MTKFLTYRIFQKNPCVGEWYILYFWNDQIVVHNGVETDFWLRHYFVWYIAWKWSHLYIFSDKISYLQNFSEKPLCGRVIYFIFLKWPNCCPQWCRDGFLIKALFCPIYCLKVVSSIHIQWQNFLLTDFFRKTLCGRVIYFIFLKWPNCCPQWCRDGFLIKALFCLIYCLKVVSSIHIQWQNFLLADFFRKTPVGKSDIFYIFEMSKLVSAMVSRSIFD